MKLQHAATHRFSWIEKSLIVGLTQENPCLLARLTNLSWLQVGLPSKVHRAAPKVASQYCRSMSRTRCVWCTLIQTFFATDPDYCVWYTPCWKTHNNRLILLMIVALLSVNVGAQDEDGDSPFQNIQEVYSKRMIHALRHLCLRLSAQTHTFGRAETGCFSAHLPRAHWIGPKDVVYWTKDVVY